MAPDTPLPELMARVALQDRAAFKSLYQATCGSLFSVALRILRNDNWADDVLQEAYVNIWHNAAAYRPGAGAPMTWMINIVRNKAIDALRARKAERAATTDLGEDAPDAQDRLAADAAHEPQQLLDDSFAGESGFFVYEESTGSANESGKVRRGLEGFADSLLKIFGI